MSAVHGIDLGKALWGSPEERIGVRRLAALCLGLPPGSAIYRALDPEGFGAGWGHNEEILSIIAEQIDAGNRLFLAANSKRSARKPRPLRIPRPWRRKEKIRNPTGEQLRAFLASKGVVTPKRKRGAH